MGASHSSVAHPSGSFQKPIKVQPQLLPTFNSPPLNQLNVGRRTSSSVHGSPMGGLAGGPKKGPLIFAAMATVQQEPPQYPSYNPSASYPSPPAEYSSHASPPPPSSFQAQNTAPKRSSVSDHRLSTATMNTMKAQPPLPPPSHHPLPHSSSINSKRKSALQKHSAHIASPPPPQQQQHQHQHPGMVTTGPSPSPSLSTTPHRTLTKSRPEAPPLTPPKHQRLTPPVSPEVPARKRLPSRIVTSRPSTVISNEEFESAERRVAIPLDDDPFAKTGGVRMLKPTGLDHRENGPSSGNQPSSSSLSSSPLPLESDTRQLALNDPIDESRKDDLAKHDLLIGSDKSTDNGEEGDTSTDYGDNDNVAESMPTAEPETVDAVTASPPPRPPQTTRSPARIRVRAEYTPPVPSTIVSALPLRQDRPSEPFLLIPFMSNPTLLSSLLGYLSYWDWCCLYGVSKKVRALFEHNRETAELLKEEVLERYLRTVGYNRWEGDREPLILSLRDLHSYLHGVTLPTFEYARLAELHLQQRSIIPSLRDPMVLDKARVMVNATRAYNRVVLRLRAQAEAMSWSQNSSNPSLFRSNGYGAYFPRSPPSSSRSVSRAPSPSSSFTHGRSLTHGYGSQIGHDAPGPSNINANVNALIGFRSPLFRTGRAPLLRVFIPSPEGDWLSDASVLECEAELRRAGLLPDKDKRTGESKGVNLLRLGDVVWDMAVGDDGNAGRMVWDGSYLIDLDYTYSPIGDLPKYIPGFAFPPSYFHRIIRTASSNPVIRLDILPWGAEVAANLQLLQDRVRTETPQGSYHNVVRWVHRSSFHIRPPTIRSQSRGRTSVDHYSPIQSRIPIPNSSLFVDPGWYGKVVVETEGTNEALTDLQDRCGPGVFPPRAGSNVLNMTRSDKEKEREAKMVWRVLRERSRPGEIWIRVVSPKEKLM
ncbi:hypothetical protein J3R30DRAFT_929322 [Lentinula aciculospora]|uniref:Uncharacterized protein n=1 Tax=Lentinula aciculospora TaxID=153920 RepID=A0A9W9DVD4_9AGAR|nr:hypothetical protein J3R30DRAFT_929322 [Lentinula aciculospora]